MVKFPGTFKVSLGIALAGMVSVSGIGAEDAATPQKAPLNCEAVRNVLKLYAPVALVDYVACREDKLVSFQPSLLAKPDVSTYKTEEAKRMAAGLLATDGFYCVAFGKNAEAAKYYDAYQKIMRELPLRDLADLDLKPSPATEAFFKDPSAATDADLDKIIKEMDKKMIANLDKLAATQEGIHFAMDFFYAIEIEALYIVAQSVIQSDGKSEGAIASLAGEESTIEFIEKLIGAAEADPAQKLLCSVPGKNATMGAIMKILKKKVGNLVKADAEEILRIVSPERKKMVDGAIADKAAK